jgi:hypothetical protein
MLEMIKEPWPMVCCRTVDWPYRSRFIDYGE